MKIKLQVLGTGCPKCRMLTDHVEQAARELGLDYELEKVTEIGRILELGATMTPALVVDGEIRLAGHVPSTPRLKELLATSRAQSA
jgi:small redox-active disulfide protein 2